MQARIDKATFLVYAEFGEVTAIQDMLTNNTTIDDVQKNDALLISATKGHLTVVQVLVNAGANVRFGNDKVLLYSAACGHLPIVRFLVTAGANVNGSVYDTPMDASISRGHLAVVQFLVQSGAKPYLHRNQTMCFRRNIGRHLPILQYLHEHTDGWSETARNIITEVHAEKMCHQ